MISRITCCRVCENTETVPVVDLGEHYLTGVFTATGGPSTITKGPLRLVKCHGDSESNCGLLQLEHNYDLRELYGDTYGYRSGLNPSMVSHLQGKVERIIARTSLKANDLVLDIGSNDGTTLAAYPSNLDLVGIDPTGEKFKSFYPPHVTLVPNFFSADALAQLRPNKKAKVITSFSMFYDLERPVEFAKQIADVLDEHEGLWVSEQSYMPMMLARTSYDTICHEHLEYYGLKQVMWIARKAGLKVIDVEFNDVNGGSFSFTAAHRNSKQGGCSMAVVSTLRVEEAAQLMSLGPYRKFSGRVERGRADLQSFVVRAKKGGKRICGLGASTKGNVILQYCGLSSSDIQVIADVNPDKHGVLTPGTWIPIEPEERVLESDPDYLLVLPWHFRDFFMKSPRFKGRSLVFPLPCLEVVTPQ